MSWVVSMGQCLAGRKKLMCRTGWRNYAARVQEYIEMV